MGCVLFEEEAATVCFIRSVAAACLVGFCLKKKLKVLFQPLCGSSLFGCALFEEEAVKSCFIRSVAAACSVVLCLKKKLKSFVSSALWQQFVRLGFV